MSDSNLNSGSNSGSNSNPNPRIIGYVSEESLKLTLMKQSVMIKLENTTMEYLANSMEAVVLNDPKINQNVTITKENWADPHKCPFGCDVSSGLDFIFENSINEIKVQFNTLHIHTIREHGFWGEKKYYKLNLKILLDLLRPQLVYDYEWKFDSNFLPVFQGDIRYLAKYPRNKHIKKFNDLGTLKLVDEIMNSELSDHVGHTRIDFVGPKMYDFIANGFMMSGRYKNLKHPEDLSTQLEMSTQILKEMNKKSNRDENYGIIPIQELMDEMKFVQELINDNDLEGISSNDVKMIIYFTTQLHNMYAQILGCPTHIFGGIWSYKLRSKTCKHRYLNIFE